MPQPTAWYHLEIVSRPDEEAVRIQRGPLLDRRGASFGTASGMNTSIPPMNQPPVAALPTLHPEGSADGPFRPAPRSSRHQTWDEGSGGFSGVCIVPLAMVGPDGRLAGQWAVSSQESCEAPGLGFGWPDCRFDSFPASHVKLPGISGLCRPVHPENLNIEHVLPISHRLLTINNPRPRPCQPWAGLGDAHQQNPPLDARWYEEATFSSMRLAT